MSGPQDGLNLVSWWCGVLVLDEVNYHPEIVKPQIDDSSRRIVDRPAEFDPVRVLQAWSDLDIDPSPVLFHELGDPATRIAASDDTHVNLLCGLCQAPFAFPRALPVQPRQPPLPQPFRSRTAVDLQKIRVVA